MSYSHSLRLTYPNGLKCRFILVYGLIGTVSNVFLMLYSVFFNPETDPSFFYALAIAAPILGATTYFANKLQVLPASYLAVFSALLGCFGSLTLQFEAFLSLLMIFVLSTLFITVNRRQMVFLFSALFISIVIKVVSELGVLRLPFIPVSNLENETIFYIALFLFSVFVFAFILSIILNNGFKASEKLAETTDKLEETVKVKDRLLALISHDLKNPIGGMSIIIKGIQQKTIPMNNDVIDMLDKTSENASKLIENLVHWSSVKQDRSMVRKSSFPICECINDSIDLVQILADRKQLKLINNCKENTMVFADQSMISTVVRNILTNAIKFSDEDDTIEIGTWNEGQCVKTYVKDNGVGISENLQETLFKQGKHSSDLSGFGNQKGSGLGLIISKEFIELNDGAIGAESQEGVGSLFWFTIPSARESEIKRVSK